MTSRRGLATGIAGVAGLALSLLALPVTPASAAPAHPTADPRAAAIATADRAAAAGAAGLGKSSAESLHRVSTTLGDAGLYYNSYERTYDGLRVVGGDAVIVADGTGRVRGTDSAGSAAITVGTTPTVDAARAASAARGQLPTVSTVSKPDLVVLGGAQPKLAYEVVVKGRTAKAPSNLHVFVDAATGKVLDQRDDVKAESPAKAGSNAAAPRAAGNGNSYYVGQVSIDTTGSGTSYSMRDPNRPGISCGREGGSVFTKSSNSWGNGSGTDLETGCVDVLYTVQTEWHRLKGWLGRSGIDGNGNGFPASVGLNDVNAYWDGSSTHFGHSQDNQRQATSMDVAGHEFGHGIFQNTPGGAGSGNENGGLNESTGDIFGAGATATFNPATVQSGGNATLTIATTASTPKGASKVTITATGANATHTSDFTLAVGSGNPPGCGGIAAWDANSFYGPGDVVSYNSHRWTSTWYSVGAEPGASGSWAVWTDNGAC